MAYKVKLETGGKPLAKRVAWHQRGVFDVEASPATVCEVRTPRLDTRETGIGFLRLTFRPLKHPCVVRVVVTVRKAGGTSRRESVGVGTHIPPTTTFLLLQLNPNFFKLPGGQILPHEGKDLLIFASCKMCL